MIYAYRPNVCACGSHRGSPWGNPDCKHALNAYYDVVEINHDGREVVLASDVRIEPARRIVTALTREHELDEYIDRAAAAECEL